MENNTTSKDESRSDSCASPCSLISWEIQNDEVIRGTITGHPETTMFLINAQYDGTVRLSGCFIPDDTEREEVWDLENAKKAAEVWLLGWLEKVGAKILSANAELKHGANNT